MSEGRTCGVSLQPVARKRLTLEEAKSRLTIFDLWDILELDGTPGRSCRSPFRHDARASFSVYANGTRWRDFATDEGGDAIAFLAAACNITNGAACQQFIALASGADCDLATRLDAGDNAPLPETEDTRTLPILPADIHTGTVEELEQLRIIRGLPTVRGLRTASNAGILHFGTVARHAAWLVMDASQRCVVARRLDGHFWEHSGSKAHMVKASQANHLIGGNEATDAPFVLLVEGTPDLLTAFEIIAISRQCAAGFYSVCLPSASSVLTGADCAQLTGAKLVWILRHNDAAGERAACRWNATLHTHGIPNVICSCGYLGANDLNEVIKQPGFNASAFIQQLKSAFATHGRKAK